ncbi:MAG: DNA alkylation response protein [Alcanivorax sp.]|nr:DNA alkylation response protein [Alcanivorax sp.]QJX02028.1 DNA alkylation response protein [Alcanivorax sp. IO_7]UWN48690.1 Putative acyl-CoA dehydrogenase AidB [Alcanivorax sp. ALC70]MAY11287.1 DNA alkylation response protein [Alcanivorax sp.]MBI55143.1 DNA alkylation response protein [Alcanivorax sp.]|tara:strand:- start:25791 stop:27470 length:1680 start_codon:yes stop_codon:yes gene_type:complete
MNAKHDDLNLDPLASTHEVFNQATPLENYDAFTGDTALKEAVVREGGDWGLDDLSRYGRETTRPEVIEWGFQANANKPEFEPHDRYGHRVDRVNYHPAYHSLMNMALREGLHSSPWTDPGPGAHVVRAAKYYMHAQVEGGHGCPVTMTFAAVPSLTLTPSIAERWLPKVTARDYDPRNVSHNDKQALTIGMGMTEKQGGSDVRANTTRAYPVGAEGPGELYELVGHKWFMSAPMCDAFLMLAQAPGGLSCFLVPRWREDGGKNPLQVQRLKNKVGNVSNASSEVELRGAHGWMVGEEGRGVPAIIEMVAMTRFDCMIGSSSGQRQVMAQAVHHVAHRAAFGETLLDQPLMRNVIADLQLEVEGSVAMTWRMARALDNQDDEHEKLFARLGAAVGKYWICKRTPHHAYESMECLGGNGVTENFILARLYRDAPINAIWEGSGNVQALDLLRAMGKSPKVLDAWFAELAGAQGRNAVLDAAVNDLRKELGDSDALAYRARDLVDRMALTMQAAQLVKAGNEAVSDAFITARLANGHTRNYGSLPRGVDVDTLVARANPWNA